MLLCHSHCDLDLYPIDPKINREHLLSMTNVFIKFNPFPNDKFQTCPNQKSLQTTISKLMKMAYSFLNGKKTMWEKEKLLVMSNFSFSRIVFKIHVLQTRKNQGLFGKGLKGWASPNSNY